MSNTTTVEEIILEAHWDPIGVPLSWIIATAGCYCTIQLMEQYRLSNIVDRKSLLFMASISLGGCAIWAMHFICMNAFALQSPDLTITVAIHYEGFLTYFSCVLAIGAVYWGINEASKDEFFQAVLPHEREAILREGAGKFPVGDLKNPKKAKKIYRRVALFNNMHHILTGGVYTGVGVMVTHYTGMLAIRANVEMRMVPSVLFLSLAFSIFSSFAGFWIMFRVLSFWPSNEKLRSASAIGMGSAICSVHYIGMYAVEYILTDMTPPTFFLLEGDLMPILASHGSLVLCSVLISMGVVKRLRTVVMANVAIASSLKNATVNSSTNSFKSGGHAKGQSHNQKVYVETSSRV